MIFAAKTTAAGLLALLIAFAFNLDQPQWALLTVFIVSQPELSGPVLAKSFYRVIGTLVGAAVALLLVALFAQERVLFLGALALWIGSCTFGSQYARNFAAYSFVLAGYTAAIVGIPAALTPGAAFYIASARVTEVCLGILVAAAVNRIVLPEQASAALWRTVAAARRAVADRLVALGDGGAAASAAPLIGSAVAIENQLASAGFEDREVRSRSRALHGLNLALLRVAAAMQTAGPRAEVPPQTGGVTEDVLPAAVSAVRAWASDEIDAAALGETLREAGARAGTPPATPSGEAARPARAAALRELFDALSAYATAYEGCVSGKAMRPEPIDVSRANDLTDALWVASRAALAMALAACFWILSAWPHGSTAVILAAVATARLATMGRGAPIALASVMIFSVATIPAFVIVDVLLPLAPGFPTFALAVGPALFGYAFLMSRPDPKVKLVGYLSALLLASVGQFQNSMVYDPVGLINTSIAAVVAAGVALMMWSVVAPATAEAARQRFLRIARQAVGDLGRRPDAVGVIAFKTRMAEALEQLRSSLNLNRPSDVADLTAALRLLAAASEVSRRDRVAPLAKQAEAAHVPAQDAVSQLRRLQAQFSASQKELSDAA